MILNTLLMVGLLSASNYVSPSSYSTDSEISQISDNDTLYNSDGTFYDEYKLSNSIDNIKEKLTSECTDYVWRMDENNSMSTSDITGNIPIEMQTNLFRKDEIKEAIKRSNISFNNYGGCGPIAAMGVLDYLARFLGYDNEIGDVNVSENRIELATTVLKKMRTFTIFDPDKNVFTYPNDYADGFNSVLKEFGIQNMWCYSNWTLSKSQETAKYYLEEIKECINKGFPATMFIGLNAGNSSFSGHYCNIYAYETWEGVSQSSGEKISKTFLKARLNFGKNSDAYCDSQILATGMVGFACLNVKFNNKVQVNASDFSNDFVNSDGNGQYFYKEKQCTLSLKSTKIQTKRLRCSYIENQYLVLSPNRKDAGEAYLEFSLNECFHKLAFKSSFWSSKEGQNFEKFEIQIKTGDEFVNYVNFDLASFPTAKSSMTQYNILLPKNTYTMRFHATSSEPLADRNKGRICLDEIVFEDYR